MISGHGKSRDTWPKGDRGIWKEESKVILRNTGVFVAPGSGNYICLLEFRKVLYFFHCRAGEDVYTFVYPQYFRYLQDVPGSNEGLEKCGIRVSSRSFGRGNGKASIGKNMIVGVIVDQFVVSNFCKIFF